METEIVLLRPDKTIQFNADLKIYAPGTLCVDGEYFQLVGVTHRPVGNGVFVCSAVYKPSTFSNVIVPENAQVFMQAQ